MQPQLWGESRFKKRVKSKFCISFGNQGPRVWRKHGEAQNPRCLKSSVKFLKPVIIWGAVMSAGVAPLCFRKSKINAAVYQDILEHFSFHLLTSFLEMLISFCNRTLAPAHSEKTNSNWFSNHYITVLVWPADSHDLNPKENLWGIVKRTIIKIRPINTDKLKAAIKATWASAVPQALHAMLH